MFTQFKVDPHTPSVEMASMLGLNQQAKILLNLSAEQAKLLTNVDNVKPSELKNLMDANRAQIKKTVATINDLCNLIDVAEDNKTVKQDVKKS
jgi:hypothetical protein